MGQSVGSVPIIGDGAVTRTGKHPAGAADAALRLVTAVIAALVLLLAPAMARAASIQPPNCRWATIGGANDWRPFAYYEGEVAGGIAIHAARTALESLGVEARISREEPWRRIWQRFDQGDLDVLAGAYWTAERARDHTFTKPIGFDEIRILVRADRQFAFTGLEDLRDKIGARPAGGSYGDAFDKFAAGHLQFAEIGSKHLMIKMLLAGRVDFIVLAEKDALVELHAQGRVDDAVFLGPPVARIPVHLMVSGRTRCEGLAQALDSMLPDIGPIPPPGGPDGFDGVGGTYGAALRR